MALKQPYVEENHEGKLYRLRDRNKGDGSKFIVWGDNLTWEAGNELKERVCGRELSRTARLEEMSVPLAENAVDSRGEPWKTVVRAGGVTSVPAPSAVITPTSPLHASPQIAAVQAAAMAAARAPAAESQARSALVSIPQHPGNEAAVESEEEIQVPEGIEADLESLMGDETAAAE